MITLAFFIAFGFVGLIALQSREYSSTVEDYENEAKRIR